MLPGWLWEKVACSAGLCFPRAERRGCRASARAQEFPATGEMWQPRQVGSRCWPVLNPLETGLRREALEVPAVVNVGSAHSRRRLSHAGGRGRESTQHHPRRGGAAELSPRTILLH